MATLTSLVNSGLGYFSNRVKTILDANFTALNTAVVSSADIVNDTTPQLGGNLDLNAKQLTGVPILATTTVSSGAAAVAITGAIHEITTIGADALTLADGTEGQLLNIVMVSDGGDGTLTPTNLANGSTLTFDNNDTAQLLFTAGAWYVMGGNAALA